MGPSTESLALADHLISKLGLQVDRISLAYAIMDHVEVEYADELAQPSPGGQGDALLESLVARWRNHAEEIGVSGNLLCQKIANCTMRHAAELQAALAARQPAVVDLPESLHDRVEALREVAARQPVEPSVEEDVYCAIADMIEPYVQREGINPNGELPASVHDSVAILLEHWLRTRQPVGEAFHVNAVEPCGKILYVHPAGVKVGDTLYAAPPAQAADSQPVGQIVGYMDPNADFMLARPGDCVLMGNIVLWREPGSKYTKPLYDAPPAQAVDVGAIRQALQAAEGLATVCASVDGYSREEVAASGRAMRQQFADALAKVDSQAVGK